MSTFTARISGVDKVRLGLNTYATTVVPLTRDSVHKMMERVIDKSPGWLGGSSYTTEPPEGSSYERTGGLGASTQLIQEGLSTRIVTTTYSRSGHQYDFYVLGNADGTGQAWMHVGRWPLMRATIDEEVRLLSVPGDGLDGDYTHLRDSSGLGA